MKRPVKLDAYFNQAGMYIILEIPPDVGGSGVGAALEHHIGQPL